jgi:hypothetical protein
VFPVRYKLDSYIIYRRNSIFKGLNEPAAVRGVDLKMET